MTAEVHLTREQEEKFFTIYHKRELNCANQELVQELFNEALTANYLLYGKGIGVGESEPQSKLVCIDIEFEEPLPSDEEISEIMAEIRESEEA